MLIIDARSFVFHTLLTNNKIRQVIFIRVETHLLSTIKESNPLLLISISLLPEPGFLILTIVCAFLYKAYQKCVDWHL
jgi:hypothetical protein